MPALVIKSFPEELHTKLRQLAAAHRRSLTQETIYLLEAAVAAEQRSSAKGDSRVAGWASRTLLPEYAALLEAGALTSDTDCAVGLSEERDAR